MPLALKSMTAVVALVVGLGCARLDGGYRGRQAELEWIREQCYSCLGPHHPDCSELKLKTYTRETMEVLCGAPDLTLPHRLHPRSLK